MTPNIVTLEVTTPEGNRHTLTAPPKSFKSGRTGYFATGKMDINGARHQVSLIFTKIDKKINDNQTTITPKSSVEGN